MAWTFAESPDELSITRSEESGWGTHFYGGLGWKYDKIPGTVGGRVGYSQHTSTTRSSLLDVNGDGLPDRVTESGGGYDVRFNTGTLSPSWERRLARALPPGDPAAGRRHPVPLRTLGKEEGKSWNAAAQASFGPFGVNAGYSHFQTKTTELLADADGDGLVDVVQSSGVLLNQPRSEAQKAFAFTQQVTGEPLASTPSADDLDQQELEKSIRNQLKPSDAVLEWVAPFTGRVDVYGDLAFAPRPRATPIPPERDGVRVQVFLWNGNPEDKARKLLEQVKTVGEVSVPTPIGVANLDVVAGWRIYFVLSTLADFPIDRLGPSPIEDVRYAPAISYTHLGSCSEGWCRTLTDEEQGRVEPNGAATFHFDQAADFRLAGQPAPSIAIPATGSLRIETTLVKHASTDDVRVCVQRFGREAEVQDERCEADSDAFDNLLDQTIPAGDVGTYALSGTFPVLAGEKLVFRVQTDLPVDPGAVDWAIAGRMETVCGVNGAGCDAPPPELVPSLSFVADAWFPLHVPVWREAEPDSVAPPPDPRPLVPWVAPASGTLHVVVNPKNGFGVLLKQSDALFVAVRTSSTLVVKKRWNEVQVAPWGTLTAQVHVEEGERVYFELYSDASYWAGWSPDATFTPDVLPIPDAFSPPVNDRTSAIYSIDWEEKASVRSRFGGGHHLWFYGAWHGPNDVEFDPTRLQPEVDAESDADLQEQFETDPALRDATELASPLVPRRLGTYVSKAKPGLAARVPAFVSQDGATYVGAGVMHASREGEFVQTGDGEGESTSLAAMFALGPALRQSAGKSESIAGSVSVGPVGANVSISTGSSIQKSDVLDVNGDRVIDVLSGDDDGTSFRVTDVRAPGNPPIFLRSDVRLRKNEDASASVGLGLSDPWRRLSDDGFVKALLGMFPAPGGGIGVNYSSTERELADVNGDGLPDAVERSGGCFEVRLNLGTRFADHADCVPVGKWSEERLDDLEGAIKDFAVTPDRVRRTTSISLNANAGFTLFENYGATVNWDSSVAATAVVLADVTGDGLPDYVRKSTKDGAFFVRVNRGYGFGEEQQLPVDPWPGDVTKPWLQDTGLAAAVNGVLRLVAGETPSVDTVEASGTYGEVPTIGFVFSWGIGPLTPGGTPYLHFSAGGDATLKRVSGFALGLQDMDGDGFADHVLKAEKAPRSENSAVWVRLNNMGKSNLLRGVDRPLGGSFELDYVRAGNTVAMPESRWVMSQVVVRDGRADGTPGHDLATTFGYEDGRYDRRERDFLGFAGTTESRADGSVVARTFKNETAIVKGLLETERLTDAQGRPFVATRNVYSEPVHQLMSGATPCRDATPFFLKPTVEDWCGSHFVSLDGIEKEVREASSQAAERIATRQTYEYDLENGNVTTFEDLGDTDARETSDDLHATVVYADDTAARAFHAVDRPYELVVKGSRGELLRKRIGLYDGAGNLQKLQSFLDESRYVETSLVSNADGLLFELYQPEVEGSRYWLRYEYDPLTRTHVDWVEDAHGYSSTAVYDPRFGVATKTMDVNGNVTLRVLDDVGRIVRLYGPYEASVPAVRIEYVPGATIPWARTRNLLPNGGTTDVVVLMDGLLRTVQTKKTAVVHGEGLGWTVSGRQVFDVMGRVREEGIPFYAPGTDPGYVDRAPVHFRTTDYDVLGRTVRAVAPNGGVTTTSFALGSPKGDPVLRAQATVVDAEGNTRVVYQRPDRVVAIEEHLDGRALTSRYGYDALGQLYTATDAEGHVTTVGYDRLGRRTSIGSPDAGLVEFAYDAAGKLASRRDANLRARGAAITYEYDLDQLVTVRSPFGTDVKYEYGPPGAAENGAGRIIRVLDDAGFETRGYGRLGEVVRATRTVRPLKPNDGPQTFETRYRYDSFGRMLSITYPDGERVDYHYDGAGLVRRAVGDRPATKHYDAAREVYLDVLEYDEFGQRRFAKLGNGAVTTWTYEADTQRLHGLQTVARGRTLQKLTYQYDLVGNVTTVTNALGEATGRRSGAVTFGFEYDDLYRLTKAKGTAKAKPGMLDSYETTYGFDDIHNMIRLDQKHWIASAGEEGVETAFPPHTNHHFAYGYEDAHPHRARMIGDRFLVHDGNGNVTRECRDHGDPTCGSNADHLRRYYWGDENELTAVVDGGGRNVTRFIYDSSSQRVVKLGRGGESITIGQFFALKARKAATKHVYVGETRIASKLLPPPAWDPDWSEGTTPSGPIVTASYALGDNVNGCDPSDYQPQKCPILPGPDPVIDRRLTGAKVRPETYYYHSDHLGSTSWVTDQNGRVHEHVEYFPYGEVWRDQRSDSDGAPTKGQQFLFTSKEFDEETGLVYFGSRYLDPVRATWLSTDPILGKYLPSGSREEDRALPGQGGIFNPVTLSLYAYAHWNPVRLIDPDGNDVVVPISYRWSGTGDFLHNPKNPYLIATYAVYDIDVTPGPNFQATGTPTATFEMAFEARMKSKAAGKDNILSDQGRWAEMHNVWEESGYGWGTKYQFGIMDVGTKKNVLTTTRNGKTVTWEGIRFHPGGPYFSEGCTTSPDPAYLIQNPTTKKYKADNAAWGQYVKSVIPSLNPGAENEPTYLYLPPASVLQTTPNPKK